jgi:uncharacterized protein
MAVTFMQQDGTPDLIRSVVNGRLSVAPLTDADEAAALTFLAVRPLHTVFMATLIRDNGLVSPMNRGTFYGCRNEAGRLVGLALIGHATLVETMDEGALALFAQLAHRCDNLYLIHGEHELMQRFWQHYEPWGRQPRRVTHELLMEQRPPVVVFEPVRGLRPAVSSDIDQIITVNAEMVEAECGINPLQRDSFGFRVRLLRRIEQGRVWVWCEQGRMLFKTDVLADTPAAAYLEGIWVNPEVRGRGYGRRCLSQLGRTLLAHTETVCLVVNEAATATQTFYRKTGYRLSDRYDTIYL